MKKRKNFLCMIVYNKGILAMDGNRELATRKLAKTRRKHLQNPKKVIVFNELFVNKIIYEIRPQDVQYWAGDDSKKMAQPISDSTFYSNRNEWMTPYQARTKKTI